MTNIFFSVTGISQARYQDAVDGGIDLAFVCTTCLRPQEPPVDVEGVEDFVEMEDRDDDTEDLDASFNVDVPEPRQEPPADDNTELNESFNIDGSFQQPAEIQETSLDDGPLSTSIVEERPTTYQLLPTGSKFGGPLVVSSEGYSYCLKVRNQSDTKYKQINVQVYVFTMWE